MNGIRLSLEKVMHWYDFTGQTIVITGGAGILGGDIACGLAGCGAQLAILDLNLEPGKSLLERMGGFASNVELFETDVLRNESLHEAAAAILERFGKVGSLINAAGGNLPQATTSADLKFCDARRAHGENPC